MTRLRHPQQNLELVIDTNLACGHVYQGVTELYEQLRRSGKFQNITITFTTALLMEQCHFINNDYFVSAVFRSDKDIPGADAHVVNFLRKFRHEGRNALQGDYTIRQVGIIKTARTSLDRQIVEVIRRNAQRVWDEWVASRGAKHQALMQRLLGVDAVLKADKISLGKDWGSVQWMTDLMRWEQPQFLRLCPQMLDDDFLLQAMMMVPQFLPILAADETLQRLRADCGEFTIRDYYMQLPDSYKKSAAVVFVSEDIKARKLMKEQRQRHGNVIFSLTGHDFAQALNGLGIALDIPRRQRDREPLKLRKELNKNDKKLQNPDLPQHRRNTLRRRNKMLVALLQQMEADDKWQRRCMELLATG